MADVLIDADTIRSPELRHEIPAAIVDAFLYGERDGRPFAAVSPLDAEIVAAVRPDIRQLDMVTDLGFMELIDAGLDRYAAELEVRLRACRELGVTRAAVPAGFPLETAEALRAGGIDVHVDRERFLARRRRKTEAELAGIRRATAAAEAGLAAAADALRDLDAAPLTCERLSEIVREAVEARGAVLGDFIVAGGPQAATGHGSGSGPIAPGEPVIVDLWPQDRASACFTDIARTFVAGEPDPEIAHWHALVAEALEHALAAVRPGAHGRELWEQACEFFEAAGLPTSRRPGEDAMEGFPYALGHGVGLEVHEEPGLGRGGIELRPGDVISIEPHLGRPGFGAVQIEEILLVTDTGHEPISSFPKSLIP